MMGGVKTDLWGRTSLAGLYAAGETAATGVTRCQPSGEQFPARRIGFWGARRTSDDRGRAGREAKRRRTAWESCADAGEFFGRTKGTAKG